LFFQFTNQSNHQGVGEHGIYEVCLHEIGHVIGLDHSVSSAEVRCINVGREMGGRKGIGNRY
jgi:predicted Zn-dependent protease